MFMDAAIKIILISGCVLVPVVLGMMLISELTKKKEKTEEE